MNPAPAKERENGSPTTFGDRTRIEWPVFVAIIGAVVWLSTTIVIGVVWIMSGLGDIKSKLVQIDTRLMVLEQTRPAITAQLASQGERMSRLEAMGDTGK